MKLNELIEKYGLEAISEKTNISIDNLNKLLRQDFEGLNRVKALGFLSILQREYNMDIDSLKESIKAYFEDNTPSNDEPVLVSIDKKEERGLGFLKWIVVALLLGGLWYLYHIGKLDKFLNKKNNNKIDLNDSEILKNNTQAEIKNVIIKKDKNETKVEIKTPSLNEGNMTGDTMKIVAQIPTKDGKKKEKNITISKDAGIESPQSVNQFIDSDSTRASQKDTNQTITNITINPTRGMLWYGFINIDTGKKKEFMKKESTPFELKGGRWILTTGHGFLDIVSDIKTVEVSDRNRHYFYIDSKDIKEISRKEFKRLNHGRMW
jgi:hypothetical protein